MSQEPKNKEEGFMYKFASFIVDKRNLIFLIVAIGLVFSVFSRSWVQIENQLSAYLPKESETYKGLHLMEDEFTTFGTAKLMLVNVSYDEAQAVSEQIADIDGVQSVSFDDTRDHYTNASALYDITFDYSEDDDRCETVMNDIESALDGYDMYVSATFGDTASKTLAQEIGVIVIIVSSQMQIVENFTDVCTVLNGIRWDEMKLWHMTELQPMPQLATHKACCGL